MISGFAYVCVCVCARVFACVSACDEELQPQDEVSYGLLFNALETSGAWEAAIQAPWWRFHRPGVVIRRLKRLKRFSHASGRVPVACTWCDSGRLLLFGTYQLINCLWEEGPSLSWALHGAPLVRAVCIRSNRPRLCMISRASKCVRTSLGPEE